MVSWSSSFCPAPSIMTVFQGLLAGRSGMMLVGVLLSEGGFQPIRSGFATLKLAVSWTQKTSPISFNGRNPLSRSAFKPMLWRHWILQIEFASLRGRNIGEPIVVLPHGMSMFSHCAAYRVNKGQRHGKGRVIPFPLILSTPSKPRLSRLHMVTQLHIFGSIWDRLGGVSS